MRGLMMEMPLLISSLLKFASEYHRDGEIVSRTLEGPIHRYSYADAHKRAKQLANALTDLGIGPGDRVGTLAWNGFRHFEIYYAVSGMGAITHTINPRLFLPQIAYIINHAQDSYLFVDTTFVPLLEELAGQIDSVKGVIVMADAERMPDSSLRNLLCYETLLHAHSDDYDWPVFDENTAASLCYTSGTTGNPKGVLYSHRGTMIHTLAVAQPDILDLSVNDVAMPIVPMFHANGWGIPYAAVMVGAKLVFPGARMDGASVHELLESERVTFSAGVPTVWMMLFQYLKETGKRLDHLKMIIVGGSAAPRSMLETFREEYGVEARHGWGMTEMSPVGAVNTLKPKFAGLPYERRYDIHAKQGRGIYGVEMKIVDEDGKELPHDGVAFGELKVRGPWICSAYFNETTRSTTHDADGWFSTGDVATIDADGYLQLTDRSKDVIKSGGEWISSIELENVAVSHPGVAEAAAIGVPHPKWAERPLLVVVREAGSAVTREELLAHFRGKVATWWIPDDVTFVDELPHTAVGKLLKTKLRDDFKDYVLPTARADK